MNQTDVQEDIAGLEKEIRRKQKALGRLKREAELAPVREKENSEALKEFRRTGKVPQSLKQAIEQAFSVKVTEAAVSSRWNIGKKPALVFREGDYEYLAIANVVGSGAPNNPHCLGFEVVKQNSDPRIWHDLKSTSYVRADEVVGTMKKFMRHVPETEQEKLSRLYPSSDPRRKACEQLRRMNVLPVGAYPVFYMGAIRYHANGNQIRLSLAKGKVCWGGWITKEQGEKITFVDVTEKNAAKVIGSFFKMPKQE